MGKTRCGKVLPYRTVSHERFVGYRTVIRRYETYDAAVKRATESINHERYPASKVEIWYGWFPLSCGKLRDERVYGPDANQEMRLLLILKPKPKKEVVYDNKTKAGEHTTTGAR